MAPFTEMTIVQAVERRLAAAARYRAAIAEIPEILELVADACNAPMVALKVADDANAHFAATLGIPITVDVPKSMSLCDMVSAADDTITVEDAPHDPRVATHPLVAGSTNVQFLAAAPLHYDHHVVGALCVFDTVHRASDVARTQRLLTGLARRIDHETALRDRLVSYHALDGIVGQEEVISAISHEIRTPLAAMQGNLELLTEMPGAIGERYLPRVDTVNRNAGRLCRTVDNLLRMLNNQRHEPVGEQRTIDLATLVTTVLNRLGPAAGRVRLEAPPEEVHVLADARQLEIAVEHLLSNALHHGNPEHPIVVSVTDRPYPSIVVRDRGAGLDPSELAHLGTPFFRGAEARRTERPGLGVGLAVTRGIVSAQGGVLHFDSVLGQGTTATLAFGDPRLALGR